MNKPRLLHIHLSGNRTNEGIAPGFARAGWDVHQVDWRKVGGRKPDAQGLRMIEQAIRIATEVHQPHLVFAQIQADGIISDDLAAWLGSKAVAINWTGDMRDEIRWFLRQRKAWTVTAFTNTHNVDEVLAAGGNAEWIPMCYGPEFFSPDHPAVACPPVVFAGHNYRDRFPLSKERIQMAKALHREYGPDFGLYGNNWEQVGLPAKGVANEALAGIYRGARVVVSHCHCHYPRCWSGRLSQAMASGTPAVHRTHPELLADFMPGQHLLEWMTPDMLVDQVRWLLLHPAEAQEIGARGAQRIREQYSWEAQGHRLKELLRRYHDPNQHQPLP